MPDHLPRHALDEVEATRLIVVKIRVTRIEPPGPEDGQSLPVVHFEGFSKSLDSSLDENANSGLTGEVSVKGTASFSRGCMRSYPTPSPLPRLTPSCRPVKPAKRATG